MKRLNLEIDFSTIDLAKADQEATPLKLVTDMICQIVLGYASENKGLTEKQRHKYYKILDVFDIAIEKKDPFIELDDDRYEFLKMCKNKGKFFPSRLLAKIENAIDNPVEDK